MDPALDFCGMYFGLASNDENVIGIDHAPGYLRTATKLLAASRELRLFNEDGTFTENGGGTKPTVRNADLIVYQTATDVSQRQFWMKIPVPDVFTDWTQFDLNALWG